MKWCEFCENVYPDYYETCSICGRPLEKMCKDLEQQYRKEVKNLL